MNRMRLLTAAWFLVALSSTAHAAETLRQVSWAELEKAGVTLPGKVLPAERSGGGEVLKIENPENQPKQVTLLELKSPAITEFDFAVRGRVRYENVRGKSFLELWTYFPDRDEPYFSRTLDESGLTRHLEGSSGWRDFSLPFFLGKGKRQPDRLVVNVVFKGSGTVYLGPLRLEQYSNADEATTQPGAWWGDRTGGWIGGTLGTVIGCLGGLIGVLAGRGRARGFVMTLTAAMVVVGLVLLSAGAVAAMLGQPYAVWYPLVLAGLITTIVVGALRKTIRRRYEQAELQRMAAMDLGGQRD